MIDGQHPLGDAPGTQWKFRQRLEFTADGHLPQGGILLFADAGDQARILWYGERVRFQPASMLLGQTNAGLEAEPTMITQENRHLGCIGNC